MKDLRLIFRYSKPYLRDLIVAVGAAHHRVRL